MATKPERIKIQLPEVQKPDRGIETEKWWNPVIVALLFLIPISFFIAGLILFLIGPQTVETFEYKIGRFSGPVQVYSHKEQQWFPVTRANQQEIIFQTGDKVKTEKGGDIDLEIPTALTLRLKPSSELEILRSRQAARRLKLKLDQGPLLGISSEQFKGHELEIQTPVLIAAVRGTAFLIHSELENDSSVSVLEGTIDVQSRYTKETVTVRALEILKAAPKDKSLLKPRRVNYQEWRAVTEVRDLITISPEKAVEQIDLRKKAGSFLKYVFDEGVFYKPDFGFASREFYDDPDLKTVALKIDYDVYIPGSFSGVYFKTRDLDLSKFKRLTFNLKAEKGKPLPGQFRIEFKEQLSIVRGFSVKPITGDWRFYAFEFNAQKPTPVSEMVFVFENLKIGALGTNGAVYLKDLNIE